MGKQTSVYLDENIIKAINEISKERDRSFNFIVNDLLREQLKISVDKK